VIWPAIKIDQKYGQQFARWMPASEPRREGKCHLIDRLFALCRRMSPGIKPFHLMSMVVIAGFTVSPFASSPIEWADGAPDTWAGKKLKVCKRKVSKGKYDRMRLMLPRGRGQLEASTGGGDVIGCGDV